MRMRPSRDVHHASARASRYSACLRRSGAALAISLWFACTILSADGQKSTSENTIHVTLPMPVAAQKFPTPVKLFVADVVDRSGNPQPLLLFGGRGGIFMDRLPDATIREALERSLRSSDLLAADNQSADLVLSVYLFHFGLGQSSGDFYGKVEFAVTVKDPKTGKSQQVSASGTSISGFAVRKKNIQANIEESVENALSDAVRNLLRGQALRDAILAMTAAPSGASSDSAPPASENNAATQP
jgi:hypothetical protein